MGRRRTRDWLSEPDAERWKLEFKKKVSDLKERVETLLLETNCHFQGGGSRTRSESAASLFPDSLCLCGESSLRELIRPGSVSGEWPLLDLDSGTNRPRLLFSDH